MQKIDKNPSENQNLIIVELKKQIRKPKNQQKLRSPISKEIYDYLMNQQKPQSVTDFVWARSKIAVTLLRAGGFRVNEIRTLTWEEIQKVISEPKNSILPVYQSKTRQFRHVAILSFSKKEFEKLSLELELVFKDDPNWKLGYSEKGYLMRQDEWNKAINNFMKPASKHFHLELKSHSFRINYVTQLLKKFSIEQVKVMIGHKSINTTDRYNRFNLQEETILDQMNQALDE